MIRAFDDKDPDSTEWFSFDFGPELADGDMVVSIVETAVDVGDTAPTAFIWVDAPGLVGTVVTQKGTKGTPGVRYTIRARVQTVSGEVLDMSGYVYIASQ